MLRHSVLAIAFASSLAMAALVGARPIVSSQAKPGCACCGAACACPSCSCDAKAAKVVGCDCCGTAACCSATDKSTEVCCD